MEPREPKNKEDELVPEIIDDDVDLQKRRVETKLYSPRDVEGEPNWKRLEIIKDFDKFLSEYGAFIGVSPYGSSVNGYNLKSSDIDINVLRDLSKVNDVAENDAFNRAIEYFCRENHEKNGTKIEVWIVNVDIDAIKRDIRAFLKGDELSFPTSPIAEMSEMVTGDKIKQYRAQISAELKKMPKQKQKWAMDVLVDRLTMTDSMNLGKKGERIPALKYPESENIRNKRRILWKRRVLKIWGIED
ncbi:MAG: hypothetical protein WC711_01100 [Candidatus Staskawiczbacteria bacterium]|jgi:hypothetical protein